MKKFGSRMLSLMLTLAMMLGLVSAVLPLSAFATAVTPEAVANGNLLWKQDFEGATAIKNAMYKVNAAGFGLGTSVTDANDKVAQLELTGVAPAEYYLVNYSKKTYCALSTYTLSEDGKSMTGVKGTVSGTAYTDLSGTINTSTFLNAAKNASGTTVSGVYICTGALADALCGISHTAKQSYFANPSVKNEDVDAFVVEMNVFFSAGAKATKNITMYMNGTKVSDGSAVSLALVWLTPNGTNVTMGKVDRQAYVDGTAVTMTLEDWHRITMVISKETAQIEYYLDGEYAYTAKNNSTGTTAEINAPINLTQNSLYIQLNRLHDMSLLNGYVQLDDVSFYSSTDGLGLTKNTPVWRQDFETETSTTNAFYTTNGSMGLTLTDSDTDSTDRVAQLELKGMAPSPYYLVNYSGKKYGALSGYTLSADGKTMTGGTATVNGKEYTNVQGTINTASYSSAAKDESGATLSGLYICTGELADTYCIVGNTAKPINFKNPTVNNADVDAFVLEMNIYLPQGAKAEKTINSHVSGTKVSDGSTVSVALFSLVPNGSSAKLQTTDKSTYVRGSAVTLALGQWHRLTFVINKNTSVVDVYTDGQYAYTARNNSTGSLAEIGEAINLTANSWTFQFNRLSLPKHLAKYFQVDDAAIYTSPEDCGLYMREDFEAYSSKIGELPTLGTLVHQGAVYAQDPVDASNVAVKLPFDALENNTEILMRMSGTVPVEKGYYTVTRNADTNAVEVAGCTVTEEVNGTYTVVDGSNTYTGVKLGTLKDYYDYWGGDGAVDQNWKLNHYAIDYNVYGRVTMSVDYYLSADAVGKFIGQIHSYQNNGTDTSWLNLYAVNAQTGGIGIGGDCANIVLKKGAWNTVMISIDLASGMADLYVNGSFVESKSLGGTNLVLNGNSWNFCKVPRKNTNHYGSFEGYFMVDNVQIRHDKAAQITLDTDGLLYVEVGGEKKYDTNVLYLPYGAEYNAVYFDLADYSGMLTTEAKNSIRLSNSAGLRYATRVDVAKLDELFAMLDSGFLADVSFGTMIAPTDFIASEFTMEAFDGEGKPYLPVEADRDMYFEFDEDAATTHFVGSIVDFYETNITRDFSGRGYVRVTLHNGQVMTLYSDYTQSANVKDVATKVLELNYTWTDSQKNILDLFAAGKQPPMSDRAQQIQDLAGLNVLALGDSHFKGSDTQWITLLAQQSQWNLTNLGMSGWTVAYNPDAYPEGETVRNSMYDYLYNKSGYVYGTNYSNYYTYGDVSEKTAEDVDLIFFDGGWNDFMWGIPLGDVDSTDGSTLQGARNLIIQKLLSDYPNAQIILISEWDYDATRADGAHRVDFVSDGLRAFYNANYANNDRVKLVDAGDPAVSGVNMEDTEWRETYAPDGIHLNAEGMKIFANNILEHIWKTYFNK